MLGAITKRRFFADAMLDATGLKVLARIAIRSDDNLLRAIARFLEEEGVPITDPTPFLADRLAPEGVLGRHAPTEDELADARYGLELARGIGRLDLGQTVVVKDRVALAVEALEGTDACIRRGGELAPSGGIVVVKAVKPQQDRRFDLPAVGPETVDSMAAVKGRVLAVEAGATLVMDLDRMVEKADQRQGGPARAAVDGWPWPRPPGCATRRAARCWSSWSSRAPRGRGWWASTTAGSRCSWPRRRWTGRPTGR